MRYMDVSMDKEPVWAEGWAVDLIDLVWTGELIDWAEVEVT